jgi:hypothetical protein
LTIAMGRPSILFLDRSKTRGIGVTEGVSRSAMGPETVYRIYNRRPNRGSGTRFGAPESSVGVVLPAPLVQGFGRQHQVARPRERRGSKGTLRPRPQEAQVPSCETGATAQDEVANECDIAACPRPMARPQWGWSGRRCVRVLAGKFADVGGADDGLFDPRVRSSSAGRRWRRCGYGHWHCPRDQRMRRGEGEVRVDSLNCDAGAAYHANGHCAVLDLAALEHDVINAVSVID